jgi:thymidylate synthase
VGVENKMREIDKLYISLCEDLLRGNKVEDLLELNNACFTLEDITDPIIGVRNISISYLCGELLWYFTRDNSMSFIDKFSKMWGRISDDGVTSNSAYGKIVFEKYGFDQVETVIELLSKNKHSKRALINFNVPNKNKMTTKDEICTIVLQFYIRDGRLNCTAVMRSNDIWRGLPYDIVFFTILQRYIADRLGMAYGSYTHFAVSLHVYERDIENLTQVIKHKKDTQQIVINDYTKLFDLDLMRKLYERVDSSESPREEVIIEFYTALIISFIKSREILL